MAYPSWKPIIQLKRINDVTPDITLPSYPSTLEEGEVCLTYNKTDSTSNEVGISVGVGKNKPRFLGYFGRDTTSNSNLYPTITSDNYQAADEASSKLSYSINGISVWLKRVALAIFKNNERYTAANITRNNKTYQKFTGSSSDLSSYNYTSSAYGIEQNNTSEGSQIDHITLLTADQLNGKSIEILHKQVNDLYTTKTDSNLWGRSIITVRTNAYCIPYAAGAANITNYPRLTIQDPLGNVLPASDSKWTEDKLSGLRISTYLSNVENETTTEDSAQAKKIKIFRTGKLAAISGDIGINNISTNSSEDIKLRSDHIYSLPFYFSESQTTLGQNPGPGEFLINENIQPFYTTVSAQLIDNSNISSASGSSTITNVPMILIFRPGSLTGNTIIGSFAFHPVQELIIPNSKYANRPSKLRIQFAFTYLTK